MINWILTLISRKEITYHDNDYVKTSKSFFRNIPHGVWKYYNHEGTIEREIFYRRGKLIGEDFYTHDGRLYQLKFYSDTIQPTQVVSVTSEIRDYFMTLSKEEVNKYVANNAGNKVVVLEAVKRYSIALKYADDSLKKDKDLVEFAVFQDGSALKYADDSLREDKEFLKILRVPWYEMFFR